MVRRLLDRVGKFQRSVLGRRPGLVRLARAKLRAQIVRWGELDVLAVPEHCMVGGVVIGVAN